MEQSFLCEKDGKHKRFTHRQLQAMGQNDDGTEFNGWKIIEEPKVPEELLRGVKGPEIEIPKTAKGKSKATGKGAKVVELSKSESQQTENKDEHSGKTETGAEGSGADASGEEGEDSLQSSQGDSAAE